MSTRRKQRRMRKVQFIASLIFAVSFLLSLIGFGIFLGRNITVKTNDKSEIVQHCAIQTENNAMEVYTAEPPQITVEVMVCVNTKDLIPIDAEDTYISDEIQTLCINIGNQTGYCPEFLMSIIEAESSGRQYAENGSCKGLMQINTDWPEISEYMEQHGYTDVYDCETNIRLGCYVLDQKRAVYGNDLYAVLMGYNGSSNVMERMENGDYTDYAIKVAERAWELERLHGK